MKIFTQIFYPLRPIKMHPFHWSAKWSHDSVCCIRRLANVEKNKTKKKTKHLSPKPYMVLCWVLTVPQSTSWGTTSAALLVQPRDDLLACKAS